MLTKEQLISGMTKYNTPERKIEYLEAESKKGLLPEVKKEAMIMIGKMYEEKKWWNNAAKHYQIASDLTVTDFEKKPLFFKTGEMFIKADDYFSADDAFRKAIVICSEREKKELLRKMFDIYLNIARNYESEKKQTKAIMVYNRLLSLPGFPFEEGQRVREKLVGLYDKIGKPFEANQVRNQIKNQEALVEDARSKAKQKLEEAKTANRGQGFYDLDI